MSPRRSRVVAFPFSTAVCVWADFGPRGPSRDAPFRLDSPLLLRGDRTLGRHGGYDGTMRLAVGKPIHRLAHGRSPGGVARPNRDIDLPEADCGSIVAIAGRRFDYLTGDREHGLVRFQRSSHARR